MKQVLLNPSLRAFVALAEQGTLALAGQTTHRSASAVSLQISALEERLGRQLFTRGARGMTLTPAGKLLLQHAHVLLETEHAAMKAIAALGLAGTVRFGMPQDFATSKLTATLSAFRKAHPAVSVAAVVERSSTLSGMVARQEVDLAVLISRKALPHAVFSARKTTCWHAAESFRWRPGAPLPLVLVDSPCIFRDDAVKALERAGIRHEVAFASSNVSGMWAAVQAGVGVTARMGFGAPQGVVDVSAQLAGAKLPSAALSLVRTSSAPNEAVGALARLVAAELEA